MEVPGWVMTVAALGQWFAVFLAIAGLFYAGHQAYQSKMAFKSLHKDLKEQGCIAVRESYVVNLSDNFSASSENLSSNVSKSGGVRPPD